MIKIMKHCANASFVAQVEEMIGPIIMLASKAGSFVNGTMLAVDGAISATAIH